jgi:hypothetical protein
MPELKDFRQTKEITLSKFPDSKIEIYDSILAKDAILNFDSNNISHTLLVLSKLIKNWNFNDDKGQILPINVETIGWLDGDSINELSLAIQEFALLVKKKD